ncbi:putative nuclease HARBI1 [Anguilla rostrata]|uniref:putative nuclease HARBI1 n=1 Tax=Anguilla rostrata TaxID=7938 RepID=UPI0030CFA2F0
MKVDCNSCLTGTLFHPGAISLAPQPGAQQNYNRAHRCTRSVVERGIGQWKRRFHVLHGEIRQTPQKASNIIMACAVLHNICKMRNIPLLPDEGDHNNDDDDDDDDNHPPNIPFASDAIVFRQHFANLHFGASMSSTSSGLSRGVAVASGGSGSWGSGPAAGEGMPDGPGSSTGSS